MRTSRLIEVVLVAAALALGSVGAAVGGTLRIKAQYTPAVRSTGTKSASSKLLGLTSLLTNSSGGGKGGKAHALSARSHGCVERMRWVMVEGDYRYQKTKVCM